MHLVVDNTLGTYLSDYAVTVVGFLSCVWLLRCIAENKVEKYISDQYSKWLPWNWPDVRTSTVTIVTYMVIVFTCSIAMTALFGGILHQVLIEVEQINNNWYFYVISWKIMHAFLVPGIFALFCLSDQMCLLYSQLVQETPLRLPKFIRIIYYAIATIVSIVILIHNFVHMFIAYNPFDQDEIFISFFIGFFIYALSCTTTLVYKLYCRISASTKWCPKLTSKDVTFDIVLHTLVPYSLAGGAAVQFFLAPKCSPTLNGAEAVNCPLPMEFNHNCCFHLITGLAIVMLILAEKMSIQKRKKLIELLND